MAGFANDVVYANNGDFSVAGSAKGSAANGLNTNGQMWIGTTAANVGGTHINVGTITSPGGSITVGYSSPNITLDLAGGGKAIESIAVQTGTSPIVPTAGGQVTINGATVVAGTNPIRTDGTGANTMAVEVQISQALAATDATKIGLSNFNSAQFTVDANGFVSLAGGVQAVDSFQVDAHTAPGTNPVVPTAGGLVTITGAQVATGTIGANVIRTDSLAANSMTIEIQRSTAVAATDSTKNGVSHFDSARFTVDANGFVSANGAGLGETITGDSGGALSPTAGNWNILGLSGSKTSGSGSTLTIKSPPFSQVGATSTSVLNTGEFVTAAVTRTLPASAGLSDGDLFIYVCTTASALIIQSVTAQKIRIGNLISTAAGTATSTAIGDALTLRFNATDGFFYAVSVIGTWLLA